MSLLDHFRHPAAPAPAVPCCWVVGGADPVMCRDHERAVGERVAVEARVGYVVPLGSSGSVHFGQERHDSDAPGQHLDREVAS